MTVVSPDAVAEAKALLLAGRTTAALAAFRALVDLHPNAPSLRYGLGSALAANGDAAAATDAWATARIFHSLALMRDLGVDLERVAVDAGYAADVGRTLMGQGLPGVAASALAKAAEAGDDAAALADYALALVSAGQVGDAFEPMKAAGMVAPHPALHAHLVTLHTFVHDQAAGRIAEARAWAARYAAPAARPEGPPPGRPLRVGYLATHFASETLQRYALPAIAHHDPAGVYPVLYLAEARGAPRDEQIRSLESLDDAAAADVIRRDEIDILVDLAGHAPGGRLGVFALRPAPVQVAWSRDPYTTGLAAIDYLLQADAVNGGDLAGLFVETPVSVGPVAAPYRPPHETPATPTPALARGHVTFGFFGAPAWLSDETVALWGRVLAARPATRLVLKHELFEDPVVQRQTAARFAVHGVAAERIEFRGPTVGAFHAEEFGDIDIALQPAACVEPTPLVEMLSHGVPVLALEGADLQSRVACYPLKACGLYALAVTAEEDFVALAGLLADDLAGLAELRSRVFAAFQGSAFRDEAGFAWRLEAAYGAMIAAHNHSVTAAAA